MAEEVTFSEAQRITTDDWPYYVPTPDDDETDDQFALAIALDGNLAAVGLSREPSTGDVFLLQKNDGGWTSQAIVKAWDGDEHDRFGESIALHAGTMVVGAPYDDFYTSTGNPGSAYVFEYDAANGVWSAWLKLQPADALPKNSYYWYGCSVAVLDDMIAVGASMQNPYSDIPGSAYIYSKTSNDWEQVAKLSASDGFKGNRFGNGIVLTKDYVAVAACPDDEKPGEGAVYVYDLNEENNDWLETKLMPPTPGGDTSLLFGHSIAASGNTIVVAAPGTNQKRGSVHVFERIDGGWQLQAELLAPDPMEKDYFGIGVDISTDGNTIVVGSGIWLTSKPNRFFVYRFERRGESWVRREKIIPSDATPYKEFGRNIAVSDETLLLSAHGPALRGYDIETARGVVYAFEKKRGGSALGGGPETFQLQQRPPRPQNPPRGGERRPWMNILMSVLILYIIQRMFFRNPGYP